MGLKVFDATVTMFFFLLLSSCIRIALHATSLVSLVGVKGLEKSGNKMTGGEDNLSVDIIVTVLLLLISVLFMQICRDMRYNNSFSTV